MLRKIIKYTSCKITNEKICLRHIKYKNTIKDKSIVGFQLQLHLWINFTQNLFSDIRQNNQEDWWELQWIPACSYCLLGRQVLDEHSAFHRRSPVSTVNTQCQLQCLPFHYLMALMCLLTMQGFFWGNGSILPNTL